MELGTCSQNISGQESGVIGDTGKGSGSLSPCGSLGSSALCSHLDLGWALESGGQFPEAPVTLLAPSSDGRGNQGSDKSGGGPCHGERYG